MRIRFATWNINSVRPRVEQVARFVREQAPDVLCLQEIKCREGEFPREAFAEMGLPHLMVAGQKGWHGVAIASSLPLAPGSPLDLCREGHARAISAVVAGVEVMSLYVPAGGDVADRTENAKFDHKLDFIERLTALAAARDPNAPLVLTGDLNVAPGEFDVWNHKFMLRVVSHTPAETEAMARLTAAGRFVDLVREAFPEPEKLASWWSYRALDFRASNRGLRLDHVWVSPGLREAAFRQGCAAARVHDDVRAWPRPSDHAPVSADIIL
ncbi:MAG TPA: exodeoxyribonuclease III [Caulobacteraceae bacterium]|nr:exodeoxyribonuclease III [Caulobacteraceae bacterium]